VPRAAIYTRVSTDRDQRGRSVGEQETECRAVCDREAWTVIEPVFSDNDRSASRYARKTRPGWARLVKFLEGGGADVVVYWEASRATRDLRVGLDLRDLCERRGLLLNYSGRTYDMRDSRDRRYFTDDLSRAEGESDQTRDRVLRSVRANAARGRPHGRHLFGYERRYDPVTKQLVEVVEVPEQAAIVREAAARVLAGEALHAVRTDFIARQVPPPGREWDLTQIRRILLNPGYLGKRVHKGVIVGDAVWPAILDEDDWLRLQALLTAPARRTTSRQGELRHLVSHIGRCGVCDGHVVARRNRSTPTYACPRYHVSRPEGSWRGWPRPEGWEDRFDGVDDVVASTVVARLARSDAIDLFTSDGDVGSQDAIDEAKRLRKRLEEFIDLGAAGKLTPAALARIEAKLLPEIEAAEHRVQPANVPDVVLELAAAANPAERWRELDLADQRRVVDCLAVVRLVPAGRGNRRSFDPSTVQINWRGQD
jgi:site-specific DNA recombinase